MQFDKKTNLIEFIIQLDKQQFVNLQAGVKGVCERLNYSVNDTSVLQSKINEITIKQNKRLKTTAGTAYYRLLHINLHPAYFDPNDECYAKLWETIFHEISHIISFVVFGNKGRGHNKYWRFIFSEFGYKPVRCYNAKQWNFRGYKQREEIREIATISTMLDNLGFSL